MALERALVQSSTLLFCRRHWARRGIHLMPGEPFFLEPEHPPWSEMVNSDRPPGRGRGSQTARMQQGRPLPHRARRTREDCSGLWEPFPGPETELATPRVFNKLQPWASRKSASQMNETGIMKATRAERGLLFPFQTLLLRGGPVVPMGLTGRLRGARACILADGKGQNLGGFSQPRGSLPGLCIT